MESSKEAKSSWFCDELLEQIFWYVVEPSDRAAISEVNRQWYQIEGLTRKSAEVKFSYAVHPSCLVRRFRSLECLTIKGRPRVYDWGLLGNTWGGNALPWIYEVVNSYSSLSSVRLQRLEISDVAIAALAEAFSDSLQVLQLDKCSGFSTAGLLHIALQCRKLRVLRLDESVIEDVGGEWLHVLAEENSNLEVLSFSLTGVELNSFEDLAAIVKKNKNLTSLRSDEVRGSNTDISSRRDIISASTSLRELLVLYRGVDDIIIEEHFSLPKTLSSLAGDIAFPLDPSLACRLLKLDLMLTTALGDSQSYQEVIKSCHNLEEIKVSNIIGDEGIEAIAKSCLKLKKIRIENLADQHAFVSPIGLISLALSCINLQSVAIYTCDLTNSALAAFGKCCPQLYNFRVAVLDSPGPLSDVPLDKGVSTLLQGCKKLRKLALYLKSGGISDNGLEEAGKFAGKLQWLLLGCAGYSDSGFLSFSKGCHSMLKLELRNCPFSEAAMAAGVRKMKSLRYLWSQGYMKVNPGDLLSMGPGWTIEFIPSSDQTATQFVAYHSLSEPRRDCPPEIVLLVT